MSDYDSDYDYDYYEPEYKPEHKELYWVGRDGDHARVRERE